MESDCPMESPCGERVESDAREHDSFPICALTTGAVKAFDMQQAFNAVGHGNSGTTLRYYSSMQYLTASSACEPGKYYCKAESNALTQAYPVPPGVSVFLSCSFRFDAGALSLPDAWVARCVDAVLGVTPTPVQYFEFTRSEGCHLWTPCTSVPTRNPPDSYGDTSFYIRLRGYQHGSTPNF